MIEGCMKAQENVEGIESYEILKNEKENPYEYTLLINKGWFGDYGDLEGLSFALIKVGLLAFEPYDPKDKERIKKRSGSLMT